MMSRDDSGTVTVLVVGLTAILLLLVAVVVDVSVVILARRSAASAADGAAIASAQQLDQPGLYARGLDAVIPLSGPDVEATVQRYADGTPGLSLVGTVDQEGTTATVVAERTVVLPFVGWLGVGAVRVTAVARARAPVLAP